MGFFDFLKGKQSEPSTPSKADINTPVDGMGTALFNACLSGYTNRVRSLIDAGADPNVKSFVNYPEDALFEPGIPQEVGALLFERTTIKHRHPDFYHHMELGITNLYFPTLHGDDEIVHLLLEAGADPDDISFNGIFPLYVAAEVGNLRMVADLVEHGADIDKTTPKGNTALLNAAEEGKLDVIEYLLRHGADPSIRSDTGQTAVDAALRCGQTAAARLISGFSSGRHRDSSEIDVRAALSGLVTESQASIPAAIDMNDFGETLVARAADAFFGEYGDEVSDALQASSDVRGAAGRNAPLLPALLAAARTDERISSFLTNVTKSYCLVKGIVEGSDYDVYLALNAGADPNKRCLYHGTLHTPIIAAARSGSTGICKRLIDAGADVNQAQSNSETALANSAQLGDYDMTALLLDSGADPNKVTHAGTALAVADNLAIVMLLAAWDADPNIADGDGDLPIAGFIDQREYGIVRALIGLGTDLGHRNKAGETPKDRAKRSGDKTIIGIVVEGDDYVPANSVLIPETFAGELGRRIQRLLQLLYPLDQYQDYGEQNPKDVPKSLAESFIKARELSQKGLQSKRTGDLAAANELYMRAFEEDIVPRSANVWGWLQVLLVAKNYRDALLAMRFYHAISASQNYLLRDKGEMDFENTSVSECYLTLDFDPLAIFMDATHVSPFDKDAVEEKIASYSGLSPEMKPFYYGDDSVWQRSYRMSGEEYGSFLRFFVFGNFVDGDSPDDAPASEREFLEAEVRSGNLEAYTSLAKLIYQEDRQRAIDLCESAISKGDEVEAPYFLARLLEESDPERAKELYEGLVTAGYSFNAAMNLALMIEDKSPQRAAVLLQKAIDAGNVKWATSALARLVSGTDPEWAKELFGTAVENGNPFACTDLAFLIQSSDPERAMELCKQAIDAGDIFDSSYLLGVLLESNDVKQSIHYYRMAVEAGNNKARANLARLIFEDDRQEAIRLCEAAVDSGDMGDGAFFLAWLLEVEDVERSKELYQLCIDNGYSSGAANNLGVLVKADEPRRAKELFELAIEAGNSFYATANLAGMLEESDPERAIELYQMSIDAGNVSWCAKLARLLLDTDRERAKKLCELAVDAGDRDDAAFVLAWLLEGSDLERAKELYQICVDAGYSWGAGRNLGNLIKDEDPERAAELFEKSLQAGNTEMRVPLARLIYQKDRQRAIELCEAAVADGDMIEGAFFLAWLLEETDLERAMDLYQKSIDAGGAYGAGRNLGNLVKDEDPERAAELYEKSLSAGNTDMRVPLAKLIQDSDSRRAIELCEEAVADGDKSDGAFLLAYLLADTDPERSKELYQMLIDAGDCYAPANNLANIIKDKEPERAVELFKMAIEAGNRGLAAWNLANLLLSTFHETEEAVRYYGIAAEAYQDDATMLNDIGVRLMGINSNKAIELFKRAMSLGNLSYAPCNLGHMLFFDDPVEAQSLYETAIKNEATDESTEAMIGLSLIVEDKNRAEELLRLAKQRSNYASSIDFMANYYQEVNHAHVDRLRSL